MPRRHSNQLGFLKQISAIMAFALVLMLLAGPQSIAQASRDEPSSGSTKGHSGAYIVRMLEEPAVAYAGGIAGLKATKPAKGQKIDPYSSDVVNYVAYLDARHSTALRSSVMGW